MPRSAILEAIDNLTDSVLSLEVSKPGRGTAAALLYGQVVGMRESGCIRYIEADSQGTPPLSLGSGLSGFYALPRIWFDAQLGDMNYGKLSANVAHASRVGHLMKHPEGRAYWAKHGEPLKLKSDTGYDTQPMRMLRSYIKEKSNENVLSAYVSKSKPMVVTGGPKDQH